MPPRSASSQRIIWLIVGLLALALLYFLMRQGVITSISVVPAGKSAAELKQEQRAKILKALETPVISSEEVARLRQRAIDSLR
ncbi:MAG: hypothetical protein HYT48_02470 [Candidatus Vogelbacteria bacterium]|nr:hypothetical protein [Candidatus Vogelbacteria bacterium]